MPRYDVRCPAHGVHEVFRHFADRRGTLETPLSCEAGEAWDPCQLPVEQVISSCGLPQMRIDCAGEDSKNPARIADGSAKFNVGLRGVDTVVGKRRDGKPKLAYRPLTNHEAGSNHKIREIAKRQGLTPVESGAYRPIGGR